MLDEMGRQGPPGSQLLGRAPAEQRRAALSGWRFTWKMRRRSAGG